MGTTQFLGLGGKPITCAGHTAPFEEKTWSPKTCPLQVNSVHDPVHVVALHHGAQILHLRFHCHFLISQHAGHKCLYAEVN